MWANPKPQALLTAQQDECTINKTQDKLRKVLNLLNCWTLSISSKNKASVMKVESGGLHLGSQNAVKQYALPGAYQFAHLPCPR